MCFHWRMRRRGLCSIVVLSSLTKTRPSFFILCLWLIAIALLAAAISSLQSPAQPVPSLLDRRIDNVDFRGTPLKDAMVQLGAAAGVKLVADPRQLEADGVPLSHPIYLRLQDVTLQTAFDRLDFDPVVKCVLLERGRAVHVVVAQAVPVQVRIYDIHDLVERMSVAFGLRMVGVEGVRHPSERTATLFDVWSESEIVEQIIHLVNHLSYNDLTSRAPLKVFAVGTRITVVGRPAVHRRVIEILRVLRAMEVGWPNRGVQ